MEESVGVGEVGACLGKYLGVGHPPQALIALRTVGRYREIVGTLPPKGVRDNLIDEFVTCCDGACLQSLGDRGNRQRFYFLNFDLIGSCHRDIAIAEEGTVGIIAHKTIVVAEGVVDTHTCILNSEVAAMHAALRTVHAAALGTIAVVQNLTRQTGEHGTFLSLE